VDPLAEHFAFTAGQIELAHTGFQIADFKFASLKVFRIRWLAGMVQK
jgi:hypothetical protein